MTADQATLGGFFIAAIVALATSARWLWPRVVRFFHSLDRMFETINGRPEERDKANRVVQEAVPSLSVQLADLRADVNRQAAQDAKITALDERVTAIEKDHANRLDRLEAGSQIERLASKAESVQAWRAVEAIANQGEKPDDN